MTPRAWASAAIGAVAPLHAQTPARAAPDAARRDTAGADTARARPRALPPVVVTGTRLTPADAARATAAGAVSVVPLRAAAPGPAAVPAALATLPGVTAFDDQGARLQPELAVRGFLLSPVVGQPQGVSVFLDGVRVNEPDAQEVNFDLIPTGALAGAALVRGPGALYGKNSLGGALLLTTRRGGPTPELTATLGAGRFGERVVNVSAGGRVPAGPHAGPLAGLDGFVLASASDETGWRAQTGARTRLLFATAGRKTDDADVAVSVLLARDAIHQAGSLPEREFAVDPRLNYTPGDVFRPDLVHDALRGERPRAGGVLRANAFGRWNAVAQYNANVPPPNTDGRVRNASLGGTAEWTRPTRVAGRPVAVTVGAEYSRNDVRFRLFAVDATRGLDSLTTAATANQDDAALYAQGIVALTRRLSATLGARGDYVRVPYRDQRDAANDGTNVYTRVSPQAGLAYQIASGLRGVAAFKTGFRAPAPLELACAAPDAPCALPSALGSDPRLAPVATRDVEAGLTWDLGAGAGRRATLDVAGYRTDVRDDILFAAPTATQGYFVNVPRTRRAGVELAGTVALPAGLRLAGGYGLVAATYQSAVRLATADSNPAPTRPGDQFPSVPRHSARLALGGTHAVPHVFAHVFAPRHQGAPGVLDAELAVRTVSRQYLRGDEANRRPPLPGYAVATLRAALEVGRLGLSADVDNLFDRAYASFGALAPNARGAVSGSPPAQNAPVERFLTPGLPRTLRVSVRVGA